MKKYLFGLAAVMLALNCFSCKTKPEVESKPALEEAEPVIAAEPEPDTHNSRTSLDWEGVYRGITPAADAEGIEVEITLNGDQTYQVTYLYIGKGDELFIETGTFQWDDQGSTIILETPDLPPYYQVAENKLIQLDMEGNLITGEWADRYILEKQQ